MVAVVGKTEGNGGVNDFTRILADQAFRKVLMDKGTRPYEEVKEIPMVWSGGTDGILCPHATIFAKVPDSGPASGEPRLAVGYAMSDVILPEDIQQQILSRIPLGRVADPDEIADVVAFLATRGSYIHGSVLHVNGGMYGG